MLTEILFINGPSHPRCGFARIFNPRHCLSVKPIAQSEDLSQQFEHDCVTCAATEAAVTMIFKTDAGCPGLAWLTSSFI
jgi:hypothetical protein